jgi:hypothetical protein
VKSEGGVLAEGAREAGEDPGEAEAEAGDGAVGVRRAVAADGLHGLDEEAEAANRRHVERQRRGREGQRHQQLQHRRPRTTDQSPFRWVGEAEAGEGRERWERHQPTRTTGPCVWWCACLRGWAWRRCTPGKGEGESDGLVSFVFLFGWAV